MSTENTAQPVRNKPPSGYLLLPKALARGTFLKWLRRTHAWFGLWGAALGFLFGFTGILLNHHNVLKIHLVSATQNQFELPLPTPQPATPQAMANWLSETLHFQQQQAKVQREAPKTVLWNNQPFQQPALWKITLRNPQHNVQADYWEGNAFVSIKQEDGNFFSLLTRLHKGSGMGVAWVLLVDTLAGGLIVLSLTGTLMWTHLHGTRLLAAGLGLGSLILALFFTLQAIGS